MPKKRPSEKLLPPERVYPTSYQAVDILIWDPIRNKVLLGRKKGRRKWVSERNSSKLLVRPKKKFAPNSKP